MWCYHQVLGGPFPSVGINPVIPYQAVDVPESSKVTFSEGAFAADLSDRGTMRV